MTSSAAYTLYIFTQWNPEDGIDYIKPSHPLCCWNLVLRVDMSWDCMNRVCDEEKSVQSHSYYRTCSCCNNKCHLGGWLMAPKGLFFHFVICGYDCMFRHLNNRLVKLGRKWFRMIDELLHGRQWVNLPNWPFGGCIHGYPCFIILVFINKLSFVL